MQWFYRVVVNTELFTVTGSPKSRLEAIALRLEAIAIRLEVMALRLDPSNPLESFGSGCAHRIASLRAITASLKGRQAA